MSVFTRNAIQGKTLSSGMNTNQSEALNCENPQPQYSHQKCAEDTTQETLQSRDETGTEALILSYIEESDFEVFLEEITEITETPEDDLFDWELFVRDYLSTESASGLDNESQDLSLTPQFSSTKMEDYDEERVEVREEITEILGDWMDWCYHMERRLDHSILKAQAQYSIKAQAQ